MNSLIYLLFCFPIALFASVEFESEMLITEPKFTQGHGEHCNNTFRCNPNAFLHCNEEEICDCHPDSNMLYQPSTESCVGYHIEYEEDGPNNIVNCYRRPTSDGIQRLCVEHATCLVRNLLEPDPFFGYCHCSPGYVGRMDKTCGRPKSDLKYGMGCNSTFTCSEKVGLVCNASGICDCKYRDAIYQETHESCRHTHSKICFLSGGPFPENDFRCVSYAECEPIKIDSFVGICKCVEDYEADDIGKCVPANGQRTTTMTKTTTTTECNQYGSTTTGSQCTPQTDATTETGISTTDNDLSTISGPKSTTDSEKVTDVSEITSPGPIKPSTTTIAPTTTSTISPSTTTDNSGKDSAALASVLTNEIIFFSFLVGLLLY